MEQLQNLLFLAYLLRQRGHELEVCYHGCREVLLPDCKTPTYVRGMIESEGTIIPIIDPGIFFSKKPVNVTNSTCILIVEHSYESHFQQTGIIIEDIEEIMNLATGMYNNRMARPSTFNMRFVLETSDSDAARELLSDTHLTFDLCAREKQAEADYAAFQEITSRWMNLSRH